RPGRDLSELLAARRSDERVDRVSLRVEGFLEGDVEEGVNEARVASFLQQAREGLLDEHRRRIVSVEPRRDAAPGDGLGSEVPGLRIVAVRSSKERPALREGVDVRRRGVLVVAVRADVVRLNVVDEEQDDVGWLLARALRSPRADAR